MKYNSLPQVIFGCTGGWRTARLPARQIFILAKIKEKRQKKPLFSRFWYTASSKTKVILEMKGDFSYGRKVYKGTGDEAL